MTYEINQLQEPERHLAVTRFTATPEQISTHVAGAFSTVFAHLGRDGIEPLGPPIGCYVMADAQAWVVRVGCEVKEPITADGAVEPYVLPARDSLSTEHVGPYDDLPKAYEALQARAQELGRELDPTTMWEQYLTGPDVPPEQMRTVIHWPLMA